MIIVGHRGARDLWPENSLSGFRQLIATGADAVEFDVQETRDHRAVVLHDPLLDRTTLGSGPVARHTGAEVLATRLRPRQGLHGGPADECVPALEDVLALFKPTGMELHVEIKTDVGGELDAGTVPRLVKALHEAGVAERSILTCFVPAVLEQVVRTWPGGRVLASLDHRSAEMLGGITQALARYAAIPNCVVAVQKALLTATWDPCLRALGSERLGVWVINEAAELRHWMAQPLRQITTDRPDLALAARNKPTELRLVMAGLTRNPSLNRDSASCGDGCRIKSGMTGVVPACRGKHDGGGAGMSREVGGRCEMYVCVGRQAEAAARSACMGSRSAGYKLL